MKYALRHGVLVPRRTLERGTARRKLPDARFPNIWIPRVIPVRASVAVDANSTALINTTNTGAFNSNINLTVGTSLSNGALTIATLWDSLATGRAAHWDSAGTNQAMTEIGSATNSTGVLTVSWWYLKAPTAGLKNLNLTWTGTGNELQIFGISWTGVDQTTATSGFAHVTSTSNGSLAANATASLTVTSATGDAVIAAWIDDNTWAATPTNNTSLWALNGVAMGGAGNRASGAASVLMNCKNGAAGVNYASIACDIVAAASADTLQSQSVM